MRAERTVWVLIDKETGKLVDRYEGLNTPYVLSSQRVAIQVAEDWQTPVKAKLIVNKESEDNE